MPWVYFPCSLKSNIHNKKNIRKGCKSEVSFHENKYYQPSDPGLFFLCLLFLAFRGYFEKLTATCTRSDFYFLIEKPEIFQLRDWASSEDHKQLKHLLELAKRVSCHRITSRCRTHCFLSSAFLAEFLPFCSTTKMLSITANTFHA